MTAPMPAPNRRVRILCASLLLAVAAPQFATAQAAALGADEAPVRWVDGRPMLKVTLRAGDKVYFCNLLLDLNTVEPLFLHANAAGSLHSDVTDVEIGGIKLEHLGFSAKKDSWLEGLTAQFATELQQVPVAGIIGLGAFAGRDLRLDGPKGLLKLLPLSSAGEEPPASAVLSALPLNGEVGKGLRLQLTLPVVGPVSFSLATRDPFCWIDPGLARKAGAADGVLPRAAADRFLDFAQWAPFRPEVPDQGGGQGGIGGAVLQQMVLTIAPKAGRVLVEHGEAVYPEVEAALYRAVYGSGGDDALTQFLQAHGDTPQAKEAAQVLLARLRDNGGSAAAMQIAGVAAVKAAPANGKGTAALEVLEHMPRAQEFAAARQAIAAAGLAEARTDEDGNAVHKLQLELGQLAMQQGDATQARRHLLAAVFGMPTSGAANFALGRWHEQQGQMEQAMGRYFLTMLDMKNSGQQGYAAFARVFHQQRGDQADLLAELQDQADGRVPSFQPLPRQPGSFTKTGRRVLVELFTGAMCPPCVAADAACDALTELYDGDEVVLLQWHLPIPAPEPLVAQVSLDRAEQCSIRGTPTVIVAGGERIVGGGKADAIADLFGRYRPLIDAELKQAPELRLDGRAGIDGDVVSFSVGIDGAPSASLRLHAVLTEDVIAFPGKNGMLFHHHVARARLTPAGGLALAGATMPLQGSCKLSAVRGELDQLVSGFETEQAFLVRPVEPDPSRLAVVCFVEDPATGHVLQVRSFATNPDGAAQK